MSGERVIRGDLSVFNEATDASTKISGSGIDRLKTGTALVLDGNQTVTVSFSEAFPSDSYRVTLGVNDANTYGVSYYSKTVNGFNIILSIAPSGTDISVDWMAFYDG